MYSLCEDAFEVTMAYYTPTQLGQTTRCRQPSILRPGGPRER